MALDNPNPAQAGPTRAMLLRDVTAEHLGMDHQDGYGAGDVLGDGGTYVTVIDNTDPDWVEVTGFSNDRLAAGFVPRSALRFDQEQK